jgi:uncharacterized protein (TIGR02996 family)
MRYRNLGKTGAEVSCIGVGGFHIGIPADEADSIKCGIRQHRQAPGMAEVNSTPVLAPNRRGVMMGRVAGLPRRGSFVSRFGRGGMSDGKALLAAIDAHPLDDAPRLVYADWLDEQGGEANGARAEFIRVQCELELLSPADSRYAGLEKREKKLLKEWKEMWLKPLKPKFRRDAEFSRGFPVPTLRDYSAEGLAALTERDLQGAPLWRYGAAVFGRTLDTVLRWPLLPRITSFHVGGRSGVWADSVAACSGLRNVTELFFSGGALTLPALKKVLNAWTGRRLRVLLVNNSQIGDAGLRLIAAHPATASLRKLYAHTINCSWRAMKVVADGPSLDRLTLATFGHNHLGAAGGKHLLRWKGLAGIKELYLMNTDLPNSIQKQLRERLGERVDLSV